MEITVSQGIPPGAQGTLEAIATSTENLHERHWSAILLLETITTQQRYNLQHQQFTSSTFIGIGCNTAILRHRLHDHLALTQLYSAQKA